MTMYFVGWLFRLKVWFKINILDALLFPLISAHSSLHFVLPDLVSSLLSGKSHCLWQYLCTGIRINVAEYKHLYEQLVHLLLDLFYSKHTHKYPCSCVWAPKCEYAMLYIFYMCSIRLKSPDFFFPQRFSRFLFFLIIGKEYFKWCILFSCILKGVSHCLKCAGFKKETNKEKKKGSSDQLLHYSSLFLITSALVCRNWLIYLNPRNSHGIWFVK